MMGRTKNKNSLYNGRAYLAVSPSSRFARIRVAGVGLKVIQNKVPKIN
jgi:hypothetical protein